MKRLLTTVLVCLLISSSMMGASARTKGISETTTRYSWAGIKVFAISVAGWYDTNGKEITSFNNTTATADCYYLWSSSNESSWWLSTNSTTEAFCRGQAKFCLGFTSEKITIGLQSLYESALALGIP